jgi:hypothetical protein
MVGKKTPDDIITASVIPVIMNMSPYKTPNDQLAKALASIEGKPDPDPFTGNEACDWGDRSEGMILTEAAERLNLTDLKLEHDAIFHDTLPFAASLDGTADGGLGHEVTTDPAKGIYCVDGPVWVDGVGVLESKLTSSKPEDRPAPHRGPLQLQGQLMATKHTWGAVCVLYGGVELRIFLYQANAAVQSRITDEIEEFERRKFDVDWYPIQSSADGNTAYSRVDNGAPPITLEGGDNDWLAQLVNAKDAKKAAEADIDEAEAMLKERMGSHDEASGIVGNTAYYVKWPMRNFKAQPAKTTPAKPARIARQGTLTIKEVRDD